MFGKEFIWCVLDIDDCMETPCNNGGTCKDGIASYTCICPNGFTGLDCEISTLLICLTYFVSNTYGVINEIHRVVIMLI